MDVAAKDEARAVRACQRIIASRPEDYRAMSSRFEFVSRLGSEFGNANPQDMKKVKKQHGGFEAFVVAHATELFAFTPPPSPGGAPSPEDFSDFILNDVCVGEHVLELLRAQDIGSIETLRMLNLDDLRAIPGLALGPRRKLHEAITELRDGGVTQLLYLLDMPYCYGAAATGDAVYCKSGPGVRSAARRLRGWVAPTPTPRASSCASARARSRRGL